MMANLVVVNVTLPVDRLCGLGVFLRANVLLNDLGGDFRAYL
jgi:hypothetical protein